MTSQQNAAACRAVRPPRRVADDDERRISDVSATNSLAQARHLNRRDRRCPTPHARRSKLATCEFSTLRLARRLETALTPVTRETLANGLLSVHAKGALPDPEGSCCN